MNSKKSQADSIVMLHNVAGFVGGAVLGQFLFEKCFRVTRVEGPSMEPLLQKDDRILGVAPWVFTLLFRIQDSASSLSSSSDSSISTTSVARCWNDRVVVCEMSPTMLYCKLTRVPADSTSIDTLYLRGINAAQSQDSRQFGPLPLAAVKSVAIAKVWPTWNWFLGRSFDIVES
jgi:hypothetical protein